MHGGRAHRRSSTRRATRSIDPRVRCCISVANVGKRSIDWDHEQTLELGDCRVVSRPTLLTQSTSHFVRVSVARVAAGHRIDRGES